MTRPLRHRAPAVPAPQDVQRGYDLPCETVAVDGGEVRLFTIPEGLRDADKTVVCLPGLGASGRSFAPLRPLCLRHRFLFWTPPLLTPKNKGPLTFNLGALHHAPQLPERFTLLGSSYGSLIALCYALEHPERVKALVLVSPVASREKIRAGAMLAQQAMRVPLPFAFLFAPAVARVLGGGALPDEARAEIVREARRIAPHEMSRRLKDILATDAMPRLGELMMPTLVVHGTKDRVVPLESARAVATAIPHAELHEIRNAGHLPYMSHPNAFNSVLDAFLQKASRS